jgi:hypothetical protein
MAKNTKKIDKSKGQTLPEGKMYSQQQIAATVGKRNRNSWQGGSEIQFGTSARRLQHSDWRWTETATTRCN